MTIKTKSMRRALLAAALLATVAASVAYAHGTADQSNDPPTDTYFWCNGRSGGLSQGFVPSRRQLSSLDLRMFHEIATDAPVTVNVRQGSPAGTVIGNASSSVSATGPETPLVHFDFPTPLTLEPAGTFVIELVTADPEIVQWMGRKDNPYAAASGYGCGGGGALVSHDFNFVTYVPGDAAPPETTLQAGPVEGAITRESSADVLFEGTDDLSYVSNLTALCELDGQAYTPCASPVSLTLRDGRHTFLVRMADQAGKVDPTPAAVSWTIDTTPPSKPQVAGPRRLERARATYRFSARDAVSPKRRLRFRCSFDSRRLKACKKSVTTRLSEGRHLLRVSALDEAGNTSRTTVVSIIRK